MGKYKHYKGSIGGGVDISGKSKMSGKAKSLMSFPGGIPGPGEYGNIVGKGMMKYMAGEPVGMAKYKSDAQRKAVHASKAEQGAGKYGKHMGPEKELVGNQNKLPQELKDKIEAAPGKYGMSPMMKTDPKNESSKKQKNHVPGTHYGWADHKDKKGVRGGFNRAFKRAKAGGYDTFSFAYDKNKDNSVTHDEVKIYSTKTK